MKKAEIATAPTLSLKDTILIEIVGELLINRSLTIEQLVAGYKKEGLIKRFIEEIFNEMLADDCIELIPGSKPKEYHFQDMKGWDEL